MPVSKHRAKSKKKPPQLTENERIIKRARHYGIIREEPKGALAMRVARQNEDLCAHLDNPIEYAAICDGLRQNPHLNSLEEYGRALQIERNLPRAQAEFYVYTLRARRAVEDWKTICQSYILSAPLVDQILSCTEPISYDVTEARLPFRRFYVDLGWTAKHQHVGIFVNQHSQAPTIDFVMIRDEHAASVKLNQRITVTRPADADCHLDNPAYLNFVITAVLNLLTMHRTDSIAEYIDDDGDPHGEWITHVRLPDEAPMLGAVHWVEHPAGGYTWSSQAISA